MGEDKSRNDVERHFDDCLSALKEGNLHTAIFHAMKGYLLAEETKDNINATMLLFLAYRSLDRVFGQLQDKQHATVQHRLACSFCSKEVDKEDVVAGPASYICRECVEKASKVLRGGRNHSLT